MAKVLICRTANDKAVYYDDETSHAATHLTDTPQLYKLVQDFLSTQNPVEASIFMDHDAGQIVGNTDLVAVTDTDDIVYAKRLNRDNFTKFVRGLRPVATSYFTIVLYRDGSGDYELASAWIGTTCPTFPDDPKATPESKPFWDKHALVFGNQAIQEDTLTDVCPW